MYVRVTTAMMKPDDVDAGVAIYGQTVVQALRPLPGYLGAVLDVNRETGECWNRTFWASLEALNASEVGGPQRRQGAAASLHASVVDVERYEMAIFEMSPGAPAPAAGVYARINEGFAPTPAQLDAMITLLRGRTQVILGQKGGLALVVGVNRMTGRFIASSIWDTASNREASEATVAPVRREVGEAGGGQPTVTLAETVFVEMVQPSRAG